jgi:hypothetical protein
VSSASRRGRRNRQRGAELQREIVRMAKSYNLQAHNRDRGGAQHEQGDLEIVSKFYGCKRKKKIAQWLYPEKKEVGVFIRGDRGIPLVVIPAELFLSLLEN